MLAHCVKPAVVNEVFFYRINSKILKITLEYDLWRIFSDAEEEILKKNYLKLASGVYCDLSAREVMMFVFEYAFILNMKTPGVWNDVTVTGGE
jgi:hypothetical protein